MLPYEKRLQTDCEKWFRTNYYELHKDFQKINFTQLSDTVSRYGYDSYYSGYQLKVVAGPWKSLYIRFKKPGEVLSAEEKILLSRLRDHGNRVAIVRYFEDFKTLIQSYTTQYVYLKY